MRYGNLGTTDLQVSQLGIGTVQLGQNYGPGRPDPPSLDECVELLRRAVDLGITLIDTAPGYGPAEEIVGKAVAGLSPRPVVATKVHMFSEPDSPTLEGLALRDHLSSLVTSSLRNLKTECLDLVQVYVPQTPPTVPGDLLQTMEELANNGMVRHWAATTYGPQQSVDVLDAGEPFRSIQLAFNILDRTQAESAIPRCRDTGMGLMVRNVFFQGVLSPAVEKLPDRLADLRQVGRSVAAVAKEVGIDLPEVALRFAAFESDADVTLFGTTSHVELEANIAAVDAGPLPADVVAALDQEFIEDERLRYPNNWVHLL